jgi:hypothetical protein
LRGGSPPAEPPAPPLQAPDSPVLPTTLPGYELRVLDARKPVLFNIDGHWVRAGLPVFIYYPAPPPASAAPLLRQVYDGLLDLTRKPEWSAAELRELIAKLGAALDLLGRHP